MEETRLDLSMRVISINKFHLVVFKSILIPSFLKANQSQKYSERNNPPFRQGVKIGRPNGMRTAQFNIILSETVGPYHEDES
jgi:hypothetical protein